MTPTLPPNARIDLSEAIHRLRQAVPPATDLETVSITRALGRVTAEVVRAPVSLPPFPASAMDGYAFAYNHCRLDQPLNLVGTSAAGHPFNGELPAQCCLRILTGAALPDSADTVVIQEQVERNGDAIRVLTPPAPGANVRTIGQDIEAGSIQLPAGHQLTPFDLAFLAASGHEKLVVYRRVRVRLLSTGDELVDPGQSLQPGQIYDSNRQLLESLLDRFPVDILSSERIPDQPQAVSAALSNAEDADLLLTSGGVSVGDSDFLGKILQNEGALAFWRLNLKPGKPVALGRLSSGTWVLALPGNPVSTAITALLLGRPLLAQLSGQEPKPVPAMLAELSGEVKHSRGREEFQRGTITKAANADRGQLPLVTVTGDQSSNRLATFTGADCLLRIPKHCGDLAKGTPVEILRLADLLAS